MPSLTFLIPYVLFLNLLLRTYYVVLFDHNVTTNHVEFDCYDV